MGTLLVYFGLMSLGAVLAFGIASWASRGDLWVRNSTGLLFAALASYATGFLLDMLLATGAGEIPPGNVIAPIFTWLAISVAGCLGALTTHAAPGWLGIPFGLNAVLALLAAAIRPRHVFVAVVVLLLGVAVVRIRRQQQLAERGTALNQPQRGEQQ